MTTNSKILAFTSVSFKTGVSSLILLGLVGCDGLARFNTKKDAPPTESVVAEESAGTAASPGAATEAPPEKDQKMSTPLYEWKGDGRKVTRIVVNTNEQKARFYSGDEEIGWSMVATGISKYPTPTGRFQVTEKVENKRSNLYGKVYGKGGRVLRSSVKVGRDPIPDGGRFEGAHMPFFMRLTEDGVGLHAGPIPNPGQPASHGCIRMPSKIAPVVFRHVSNGTPVTIEGKGPSYGDYVAKQRANAARRAEEQRIAAQRAAEAGKAQQVAQAEPAPDTASPPTAEVGAAAPESHAVAKDEATSAARTVDATNARETRMREPGTQPKTAAHDTSAPAVSPETTTAKPSEQTTVAPTPGATQSAPATPDPTRPSIIENAPPAGGSHSSTGHPGTQPAAPTVSPEATPPAPNKPAPEIQEAPTPAPKPAAGSAETSAPAPQPAPVPAPKPAEPAPSPAPAKPEPPAAPAAAPAGSAT
ncbi:L,D-transpeptidase family protein [Allochromatium tepidum]|uniref:L,D-TPase catalytic domain-containing protein n=1 Tax=Allochromatium tepidum TaxID=553982 RepID=A0ABN6GAX8_9GAMM|nr:L,D-transpeptidase family protein [Allochromatium tepidum]BCU06814.1 hypothetical protein Atep_14910 [Allochromatium tepidum]